ncbi:hypothetical protein Taro_022185 [Colocasia esculenta]|uniref:Uncharacterized protein n=1 Tax=Colocasia esculenta TaxID=4460 RepID=A0A843VDN8_COLES|nr:hypothetical protein [Colocasia esculenta]
MGKTPVRMKAVVGALSPFQQKVISGLWKPGRTCRPRSTTRSPRTGSAPLSSSPRSSAPTRMSSTTRRKKIWHTRY